MQTEYRTLKDALELHFGRMEDPAIARRQPNFLWQEECESLEDFVDKVLTKVP